MSETPLRDAIDRIGERGDHLDLEVGKSAGGKLQGSLEAHKDFGKPGGWSGGAAARFTRGVGASIMGVLRWRPGQQ